MIKLENVKKVFKDGSQALKNINLEFAEGKINVLIGPSGCGKTTTMKLINRLIKQTEGTISIDGTDISTLDPIKLRRRTGYVIQDIGLFPHMNIYKNVSMIPKLLKWEKAKIDKRVSELLDLVNLDPEIYKYRYPSELSGGQQQRIGVIRALAVEPPIILMDEPFSALDPISREELQNELIRLQKEINKTIVFVTHDMDEALKIADQIIVMNKGEIVQVGSPEELLENPKNSFVKDFIGSKRMAEAEDLPAVRDVMENIKNDPVTIHENKTVDEALDLMTEHHLEFLPVINQDNEFKGQISLYQIAKNHHGRLSELDYIQNGTISMNDHISEALTDMQQYKSNIPVVDADQRLVGVITKDLLLSILHSYYDTKKGADL